MKISDPQNKKHHNKLLLTGVMDRIYHKENPGGLHLSRRSFPQDFVFHAFPLQSVTASMQNDLKIVKGAL